MPFLDKRITNHQIFDGYIYWKHILTWNTNAMAVIAISYQYYGFIVHIMIIQEKMSVCLVLALW